MVEESVLHKKPTRAKADQAAKEVTVAIYTDAHEYRPLDIPKHRSSGNCAGYVSVESFFGVSEREIEYVTWQTNYAEVTFSN